MTGLELLAQQAMVKEGFGDRDFHNQTTLHPVGLLALILLGIATLALPRKYAIYPMVLMACFVSPAQRLVIASLDFHMLRMLMLLAWVRVLTRGEHETFRWRRMDTLVVAWAIAAALVEILRRGDFSGVVYRAGILYDVLAMYIFFRCLLRGWGDFDRLVRFAALVCIPVGMMFLMEKMTGRNPFSFLGGVPQFTAIREGRLRAQGPFPHAILAGCFFAAWLPLVAAQWWRPGGRSRAIMGLVGMLFIVFACSSSTPISGVMAALVGGAVWVLRRHMKGLRWTIAIGLIGLHMVMKAPVWHLISRISFSQGSTSHHRFLLIDNAIRHVNEWWLLGISSTAHWGHQMFDLTNQYVAIGVKGGLISLILFVAVLVHAYSLVGRSWRAEAGNRTKSIFAWSLGVSLFAHTMMFFAISIGSWCQQNMFVLYLLLAMIASLSPRDAPQSVPALSRVRTEP